MNRNWGRFWEPDPLGSKTASSPSTFPGSHAFSAEETQLVRDVILAFQPTVFVTLHSGSLGVYTPYGYGAVQPRSHKQEMERIVNLVVQKYCRDVDSNAACSTGVAGKFFAAHGNCLDWVYDAVKPAPMVFLVETYDGQTPQYSHRTIQPSPRDASEFLVVSKQTRFPRAGVSKVSSASGAERTLREDVPPAQAFLQRQQVSASIKPHRGTGFAGKLSESLQVEDTAKMAADNTAAASLDSVSFVEREVGASLRRSGDASNPGPAEGDKNYCFLKFNPHTRGTRERTTRHWSEALLVLVEEAVRTAKDTGAEAKTTKTPRTLRGPA